MPETQFRYTFHAFGYNLEIQTASDIGWEGFYKEAGNHKRLLPASIWGDLNLAKLSLCAEAQKRSGRKQQAQDDSCMKWLNQWRRTELPGLIQKS